MQAALLKKQPRTRWTACDARRAQDLFATFAALPGALVISGEAPRPANFAPEQGLYLGFLTVQFRSSTILVIAYLEYPFKYLARFLKFALNAHTFRQPFQHKGQARACFCR